MPKRMSDAIATQFLPVIAMMPLPLYCMILCIRDDEPRYTRDTAARQAAGQRAASDREQKKAYVQRPTLIPCVRSVLLRRVCVAGQSALPPQPLHAERAEFEPRAGRGWTEETIRCDMVACSV
jgi:hypothetical protein